MRTTVFSRESLGATLRGVPAALRRHWLLVVFLTVGLALRVITQIAYQPAILYIDSYRYIGQLAALDPRGLDPVGYTALFLKPIALLGGGLASFAAFQHLTALAMVVLLYALMQRAGAPRWLSAIATLPVLLDAYQLQIEHNIMTDEPFQLLLVALFTLLVWRRRPSTVTAGVAGLLIAVMITVRLVAVTLAFPVAVYLLFAAGPWRDAEAWLRRVKTIGAMLLAVVIGVGAYAGYFFAWSGQWGITSTHVGSVYGRVSVVADCSLITGEARNVCPKSSIEDRDGPDYYNHSPKSPTANLIRAGVPVADIQRWVGEYNSQVLRNQPLEVLGAIVVDVAKGFRWERTDAPGDVPVSRWHFETGYPRYDINPYNPDPGQPEKTLRAFGYEQPVVVTPLAEFLRWYQLTFGYTPGPFLLVALLAGIAGVFVPNSRRSWLRWPCLLVVGMALTLLFTGAGVEFSWRYQLPSLILLPLAGVLGVTAWRRPPAQVPAAPDAAEPGAPVDEPAAGEPAAVTGERTDGR